MRFAFKSSPLNTTWADLQAVWQVADDVEVFESGWIFDHFSPIFSDPSGPCLEGWTTLTALAATTSRLRLGTLVTGIHHRHPAVLAKMAAAVDIISGGRLELGIPVRCRSHRTPPRSIRRRSPTPTPRPIRSRKA